MTAAMRQMFSRRIEALAADRVSGASEILVRAIEILRDAFAAGADVPDTARALVRAQPSMAPVWNAALAALASRDDPGRFEAFARRVHEGPHALTRVALEHCQWKAARATLNVVTLSYSGSVLRVLKALSGIVPLEVACAEGRPAMEGQSMAARLAGAGVKVGFMTDAAIAQALSAADVVMTGADAVAADWFLNKVGTRMLAATASMDSVPVYVVATRDKFASAAVAARLTLREGGSSEVWSDPPPGVRVRNTYFEGIPLGLVTAVITDGGVLDARMARGACEALDREVPGSLIALLE